MNGMLLILLYLLALPVILPLLLFLSPVIILAILLLSKKQSDDSQEERLLRKIFNNTYYRSTNTYPWQIYSDKGRLGEYLIYQHLRSEEKNGARFLFNVYIPRGDDGTTEIDVLMIHPKGLFVFESKNYSGWIFGNVHGTYWVQTLPAGKGRSHKEKFYNPILQNRGHIKHLEALLGDDLPYYSIICFSERCTLKSVPDDWINVKIIKRDVVYNTIAKICSFIPSQVLAQDQIDTLYNKLYSYTQVSKDTKEKHIADINSAHR